MPTLTIMSVYNARKAMHAAHIARARSKLERFKEDLVVRFGKETADAVKMQVSWTEDMIFGRVEVPEITDEGYAAVKTLREIIGKVNAVKRKIHTRTCWFRESLVPISVLETVGLSWEEVEEQHVKDERLSLPGVLRLLSVLRTTPQVMPTDEQAYEWAGEGLSPGYLPSPVAAGASEQAAATGHTVENGCGIGGGGEVWSLAANNNCGCTWPMPSSGTGFLSPRFPPSCLPSRSSPLTGSGNRHKFRKNERIPGRRS